ncbi:MAG: hypothetical protein GY722_16430 [bacterium]|nr:hypothetical protein [bacterium]
MPGSGYPRPRELNPGLIEDLEGRPRNRATQAGVDLIELDGPLRDEETYDGVHPNRVGRDRLTVELGTKLLELLDDPA